MSWNYQFWQTKTIKNYWYVENQQGMHIVQMEGTFHAVMLKFQAQTLRYL